MILIDTSVLIDVIRDKSGLRAQAVIAQAGDRQLVISRFTELELMVGAVDEQDWRRLSDYVEKRVVLGPSAATWRNAARIYYDLRRARHTVRSMIDCCIAEIALEKNILLLHNDRDFDAIATVRPLQLIRPDFGKAAP